MEGEDRAEEDSEIHDQNKQYNHQPESERRKRMDSWISSWKSNPWMLNPGINNTGIAAETTIEKPQYDDVSTSKKFIYDLNRTPEKRMSNGSQPSKPAVSPVTLETPGKRLPETTDQEPHQTIKKRARDDDCHKAPLKTPKQTLKRKKFRAKVVREGQVNRSSFNSVVKKSPPPAGTDTKTSEAVRPRRSSRRPLRYDYDHKEEDEYFGITLASEDLWRIFFKIPKRRRTNGMMRKERISVGASSAAIKSFIVSEMQSKVSRNKRSNRDAVASQLNARVLQLQWQSQNPTGAELWERCISIDAITKLFEEQDINRESPCLTQSRETAVMLHKKAYQEQRALVPHKKDGSVMPYPNAKNFQSKVKVDDETKRVWKLLMANSQSEGIDGSDEEKKQWWRKLFEDRANSFIARMRLVQGNRKFSHWKGSVVDSVVGVFLTQCVTDHTSSSVFMNLAVEFPVNNGSCHEEWVSSVTHEVLYPESIVIQEIDAVCSQEASKASEVSISSTNQLKLDPLTNSSETHFGSEASDKVKGDEEESCLVQPMCSRPFQVKKTRSKQPIKKKGKKPTASKRRPTKKEPKESFDWDSLRRQTALSGKKRERTERTTDIVDWDRV